ncbi:DNA (cytosine-5-)-methyltransferase [Clostridium sp.]|uniref:DNA cytosine methyltransferase n=1 Tax=Clostridium sp. TaxID=1506 RepID=UPI001B7BDEB3|nr:DNA (cytosine-5-)-methyltransferase [Clostridium sp.]MBP3916499.1 DNA (cytosine-5-)-methyltransferase [Clostridium sp.]MBP3931044.1 DNA (cytosine-5-)-methyltransferase [Peptostreptococcaceae bacterium]
MNVLSLFDGISCGMIALDKLGINVNNYFASEIDENAIKISKANYPNIKHIGDVTKITKDNIKNMPKIDLILGGSPCQGFSNNGKGLNFNDPRSKLFFDFVNILNWVREVNNKNVKFLLENVKMKKEWENIITQYVKVKPIEINSKLLTAQNRPRLYWSNIDNIDIPKDAGIELMNILDKNVKFDFINHEGLKICKSISENSRNLIYRVDNEVRIKQATKQGYIVANEGDGINLSFPCSLSRRGRVIKGKSNCLDTSCNICVYIDNSIRRFSINELEKLQGLPIGYTNHISDRNRIKAIGNGWTIDVIEHILRNLVDTEVVKVKLGKEYVEQLKWII